MARRDDNEVILSCVPVRKAGHETTDDGKVVVLQPRFEWRPLQAWMERMGRPHFRVKLDEVGSFIWTRCNGEAEAGEIAVALEAQFGERVAPARQRTAQFFRNMVRAGIVELRRPAV
ncbi:MAG TPA: PqqD family protein [Polyangiaceae bacterium]|nr:PqqD family protein [Polyangiaceae bacterium]